MATGSVVTQGENPRMGEFSRLIGVFFEPKKAFTDIAERPSWIVPTLILIAFSIVVISLFNSHVGWETYMHRLMDNNPRMQQLSDEQRQQTFNLQLRIVPIFSYVGVIIGLPLAFLIMGGIAMGIIRGLLGVPIRFAQAFAVMAYASLPRVLLSILSSVVMFLKKPEDFDLQNPFASNVAIFMDPEKSSKFLYSLAGSMDVFTLWVMLLMAVGLKAAGGKRLSFGGALFSVVLPWAVWVLCRAALAAAGLMSS
jgi:hypothetical protein